MYKFVTNKSGTIHKNFTGLLSLCSKYHTKKISPPSVFNNRVLLGSITYKIIPVTSARSYHATQQLLFKTTRVTFNNKKTVDPRTTLLNKLTREEIKSLRDMKKEKEQKYKDRTAANYFISVMVLFLGLAYAAVPLYRAICARTGFGGIPITDRRKFTDDKLVPVASDKRIRISFTSEVSQILPWKFTPEQREVYVLPGETALAFYKAKNYSDKDIIGMATYSITPGEAAQYFNKIQCFCFEEQKLNAGEEVDMPVFFFIDPDFANDPQMRNIDDIVLHYTFFKAHYANNGAVSIHNITDNNTVDENNKVPQVIDTSKVE
ncbi:related to Cytochrome c oxidase assembly protein COX11, mitochondrial [Saccharomycodes ludwigii]|uniref:Related to Cytochrome c oxidase assembly protein COX11, mitochondrial n=1 Tax=Saccharomycodes ludwigii TaxID=36035 RepID=A0A376B400_9ASCO|nr:hypothetical protein SCDLUD_002093 [Saccharomycodes ludwigii]KAH3902275.1 hypothetical protein SCDLUD_002093 [Saccharomycodes ludwigii]SSD59342.1 related to Cytochrome c oxidase assembly protein COX11, mitochondrial [Saccharomycodes ludwigii]